MQCRARLPVATKGQTIKANREGQPHRTLWKVSHESTKLNPTKPEESFMLAGELVGCLCCKT